jgi:hypothetical protein
MTTRFGLICGVAGLLLSSAAAAAQEKVDYLRQIKPLLTRRCYACHGALQQKSGLRLDTAAAMRTGGDGGAAIEPGKSTESLLIEAVTGVEGVAKMPPKGEGEPLTPDEIALLKRWIDEGAQAPADEPPQADPRKHWAFQRIERPAVPAIADPSQAANPIDAFIAAELERRGIRSTEQADKATLLRRVSLDLVGLPPTREELHAFLNDTAPDAYEKLVDKLLDSPQYGERWARHWMDVWRYSDWYGRRAVPDVWNSAPQVWRWRDWIVKSLNNDKGYERMVQEMLAADEIAPEDVEAAVATGYIIRNWYALNPHQWMKDTVEHTGKAFLGLTFNCAHCHDHKYDPITNEEYFRFRAFFEPVQVRQDRWPGEADPGPFQKYEYTVLRKVVPIGCVRIFDENLAAETFMYRSGDERERIEGKPPVVPAAPAFLGGDQLKIEPVELPPRAYYPGLKSFIRESETATRADALTKSRERFVAAQQSLATALSQSAEAQSEYVEALKAAPADGPQPPAIDPKLVERRQAAQQGVQTAETGVHGAELQLAAAQAQFESLRARIAADDAKYIAQAANADELAKAASLAERTASLRAAEEQQFTADKSLAAARAKADALAAGAEKDKAAAAVKTAEQALAAATKAVETAQQALNGDATTYTPLSPIYPAQSSGRRRALAEWIARRENPLTARVAVNHIWLRHFGRALVESVYDFGINGKPPSHPELLDWLAAEFMEPSIGPPVEARNPALGSWRMKHLHRLIVTSRAYRRSSAAEADSPGLAADPDNRLLWRYAPRRMEAEVVRDSLLFLAGQLDPQIGGTPLDNKAELASRRRSLYFSIYPEDGGQPRFLETFDAPDPCDCYRRTESLVPQQALALTNATVVLNQSRLLARKLWESTAKEASPPEVAATATGSAPPDPRETAFIVAAFEQVLCRAPSDAELDACREFMAQQTELFRNADPKSLTVAAAAESVAASNDPVVRTCENLVHALVNHNDFVTVR